MAGPGDGPDATADPDPRVRLMQEVAQQMDAIERDFGDDYRIGRVITLVEVIAENPDRVELRIRAGQYPWVTLGMLAWAKSSLEQQAGGPGQPNQPPA